MSTPNNHRLTIRNTLAAACVGHSGYAAMTPAAQETLIRRLERSCHEHVIASCNHDGIDCTFACGRFVERYSSVCYKLLANLDVRSSVGSHYLLDALVARQIDPYAAAGLTSVDMCPAASQQERDMIELRRQQQYSAKVSHRAKCQKCGGNETTYVDYQSTAGDELSTCSIKCVRCEHTWRAR
jgi:DNA-directed RNA polymerase subunit M/transcription elongation factor TFIIS